KGGNVQAAANLKRLEPTGQSPAPRDGKQPLPPAPDSPTAGANPQKPAQPSVDWRGMRVVTLPSGAIQAVDQTGRAIWMNTTFAGTAHAMVKIDTGEDPIVIASIGRALLAMQMKTGKEVWRRPAAISEDGPVQLMLVNGGLTVTARGHELRIDPYTGAF